MTLANELDARGWRYSRAKGVQRAATPPASHVFMRYRECKRSGGVCVAEADQSVVRDLYAEALARNEPLDLMEVRSTPEFKMYLDVDGDYSEDWPAVLRAIHEVVAPTTSMALCSARPHKHHLYFPGTLVDGDDARGLRCRVIDALTALAPSRDWAKIIDASVLRPKCGLRMPWSHKPGTGQGPVYVPVGLYAAPGVLADKQPASVREWLDVTSIRV